MPSNGQRAKAAPKMPKVKIVWGYLDVQGAGRRKLNKIIGERNDPVHHKVPVTITGFIDTVHSGDDGVSQEFAMTVTGAEFGEVTLV